MKKTNNKVYLLYLFILGILSACDVDVSSEQSEKPTVPYGFVNSSDQPLMITLYDTTGYYIKETIAPKTCIIKRIPVGDSYVFSTQTPKEQDVRIFPVDTMKTILGKFATELKFKSGNKRLAYVIQPAKMASGSGGNIVYYDLLGKDAYVLVNLSQFYEAKGFMAKAMDKGKKAKVIESVVSSIAPINLTFKTAQKYILPPYSPLPEEVHAQKEVLTFVPFSVEEVKNKSKEELFEMILDKIKARGTTQKKVDFAELE
ncbi:MAG: hypothetical protein MUC49_17450 [Raineya sp.]|jgi:hypothetical protein|nr:hypothetical protein [Raineya sp.]